MKDEITFVFGMDGDQWYCHFYGYGNLEYDAFGFGDTKKQALDSLLETVGDDLK